ncbi:MAG: SOS response-associated peptidase [Dehalococcoidia bacterium]|nr:SOS response-associated peptidase [Dehalococcoidia bacterium]
MCGRYSLIADLRGLQTRFSFEEFQEYAPYHNIAPTSRVLTVRGSGPRQAEVMRWGLVPSWAKELSVGSRMFNARGETVAEKPAFRTALRRRRCLVLADAFYEWQKTRNGKRPIRISLASGEPFAFAGLWETWKDPSDTVIPSCTIITTAPNDLISPIHDRMPVILPKEMEELWLDEEVQDPAVLTDLLRPYPADQMAVCEAENLGISAGRQAPQQAPLLPS